MPATLYRLDKHAAEHNQAAPPRLRAANGDPNAEPVECRGPAMATAAGGVSTPKLRLSWLSLSWIKLAWVKLTAWSGLLLLSLFLWWVILRGVVALTALIR